MDAAKFMRIVAGDLLWEGEGLTTSLATDAGTLPSVTWTPGGGSVGADETHWCPAIFGGVKKSGVDIRRLKASSMGSVALIIDDVLEKGEGLDLAPSLVIQTKPGSQQWVYLFSEIATPEEADHMAKMLAAVDGVGDKSGNNPVRVGRLPGRTPKGKEHAAQVVAGTLERYNVLDVLTTLEASLTRRQSDDVEMKMGYAKRNALQGTLQTLRKADPVLDWLFINGLVIGDERDGGRFPILCPWSHDHSENAGSVGETIYWADKGGGRFHCSRGDGHVSKLSPGLQANILFRQWVYEQGGPFVPWFSPVKHKKVAAE